MNAGPTFIIIALLPFIAVMFTTGNFTVLTGAGLWLSLGISIAIGIAASITAISSGLNTFGTMLTFLLSFASTFYAIMIYNTLTSKALEGMPFGAIAIIDGFSALFYVLGLFFIASASHEA